MSIRTLRKAPSYSCKSVRPYICAWLYECLGKTLEGPNLSFHDNFEALHRSVKFQHTHTKKNLDKGWKIYWFWALRKIPVQPLADH